jgi:hypothetical protein
MNFPMQANGAEMMGRAAIAATEAGIVTDSLAQIVTKVVLLGPLR